MPRYRFHLIEHEIATDDPEGQNFADLDTAASDALRQIRSMVAVEILEAGNVDLRRTIEIVDQDGAVRRIAFGEAISVCV